jgi:hypothetical protein
MSLGVTAQYGLREQLGLACKKPQMESSCSRRGRVSLDPIAAILDAFQSHAIARLVGVSARGAPLQLRLPAASQWLVKLSMIDVRSAETLALSNSRKVVSR